MAVALGRVSFGRGAENGGRARWHDNHGLRRVFGHTIVNSILVVGAVGDDDQRLRSEYGPRNMALVQRIALNRIRRRPSGKDSLTVKRKKAGWSIAYLIETIAAVPA